MTGTNKPITTVISSLILLVVGFLGIILSATVTLLYSQGRLSSYPVFYNIVKETGSGAVMIEVFVIMLSILHISAGGWMMRRQKIGALLGLGLAATDMLVYGLVLFAQSLLFFLTPLLVVGSLLTVTILLGWNELSVLPLFETQESPSIAVSRDVELYSSDSNAEQGPDLSVHKQENEDQSST